MNILRFYVPDASEVIVVRWSYSDSRLFKKCQRSWYFHSRANAKANDERRELFLLGKLQSVSAWRGAIVDTIISETLVPQWKKRLLRRGSREYDKDAIDFYEGENTEMEDDHE